MILGMMNRKHSIYSLADAFMYIYTSDQECTNIALQSHTAVMYIDTILFLLVADMSDMR